MLWGNMAHWVKLGGEDLSRYSNKIIESAGLKKVRIITVLLRKWCHNNKNFWALAPYHGGKTAGMKKLRHGNRMYKYTLQNTTAC